MFITEWKGMLFGVMLQIITGFALWECDAAVMSRHSDWLLKSYRQIGPQQLQEKV